MPRTVAHLKAFDVTVRHDPALKPLGQWDEQSGEITLRDHPKTVPGAIILTHEALHMAETALIQQGRISRRTGEAFVEGAAPMILYALASAGLLKGITAGDIDRFASRKRA